MLATINALVMVQERRLVLHNMALFEAYRNNTIAQIAELGIEEDDTIDEATFRQFLVDFLAFIQSNITKYRSQLQ